MESISTLISGAWALISRATWMPVSRGIETSRIATSGRSASARSSASTPSAASATTSIPGPAVEQQAQPSAHDAMVVSDQDGGAHGVFSSSRSSMTVPVPGCELTRRVPPASAARSRIPNSPCASVLGDRAGGEPRPRVSDADDGDGLVAGDAHVHLRCIGVRGHVREALLDHSVDGDLLLGGQAVERARLDLEVGVDRGLAAELRDLASMRFSQRTCPTSELIIELDKIQFLEQGIEGSDGAAEVSRGDSARVRVACASAARASG